MGSWLQGHLAAAWTSALQEAARPRQAPGAAHGSASRGRGTLAQGPEARHALTPAGAADPTGENGAGANTPHLEGVWTTAKAASRITMKSQPKSGQTAPGAIGSANQPAPKVSVTISEP